MSDLESKRAHPEPEATSRLRKHPSVKPPKEKKKKKEKKEFKAYTKPSIEESPVTLRPRKVKVLYTKLKFREEIYQVGDFVILKPEGEAEPKVQQIAKLINIIREGGDPEHPKWPMIEIERERFFC